MSWMKDQTEKAKKITVTEEDVAQSRKAQPALPKTSPGQLMNLQATVGQQREEISRLKQMLDQAGSMKRPIARMHEVPGRRRKLSPEEYAELKANLSKYPLAHPVVLKVRPDGDWDIVAGNNRVHIYGDLGRAEIESVVIEGEAEELKRVALFTNLFAPSLPDFEKYLNLMELEADGMERQDLAAAIGLSESHVSRIMAFDRLPDGAKTLLAEHPRALGSAAATKLAKAAGDGRTDAVVDAVRRLIEDPSFSQDAAVAMVQAKPARQQSTEKPASLVIRTGKKKIVEITTRNGVVGIHFKQDPERSQAWAKKLHDFIEKELKAEIASDLKSDGQE